MDDRRGFVLPVLMIFLVLATIGGMMAANMATQQAGSSREMGASVSAMLTVESGASRVVNGFSSEGFEWLDDGEYEGSALLAVSAGLPTTASGAANHGTARWWVESMTFEGNDVTLRMAGRVPNLDVVRRIEVIYERGGGQARSPFGSGVVGCESVTLSGSGAIDSYNSQNGSYVAALANDNGDVYTISPPGHISLPGGTRIRGNVTAYGNILFSGSARVDKTIGALGNIAFTGNPYCPVNPVEAGGSITKPGAWWCPGAILNPGSTNVSLPDDPCDPLGVDGFVVDSLNSVRPASGYLASSYGGWVSGPVQITANSAYSNGFSVGAGNTVNVNSVSVDWIFVQGNVNVGGGSTVTIRNPNVSTPGGRVRWFIDGNLTLGGGAFLTIEPGAALDIFVTGTANIGGGLRNLNNVPTTIVMEGGQPTVVPTFALYSAFTGTNGVTIGGDTSLYASVYAPRTGVTVTGSGRLFGAVRGRTATVSGGAGVTYDEALGLISGGAPTVATNPRIRRWSEVVGSEP